MKRIDMVTGHALLIHQPREDRTVCINIIRGERLIAVYMSSAWHSTEAIIVDAYNRITGKVTA